MIESPPTELAKLFADELAAPPILDRRTRAAVRTKLGSTVGSAPLGGGGALAVTGKVIAVLALTVGLGTWFAVTRRDSEVAQVALDKAVPPPSTIAVARPPSTTAVAPPVAPPAEVEPPEEAMPIAAPKRRIALPRKRAVHVASPPAVDQVPEEPTSAPPPSQAALVREAWASLTAGNAEHALALALRDRTLHPDGALVEERDALEVEALAKIGRPDEARAAAARFFASYPDSIHRTRVERVRKDLLAQFPEEEP